MRICFLQGGLGSPAMLYLAAAGVGHIGNLRRAAPSFSVTPQSSIYSSIVCSNTYSMVMYCGFVVENYFYSYRPFDSCFAVHS